MYNAQIPPENELPSHRQLWRSTAYALGIASLLMATVVLPAEYGRDPTGVGGLLGLTSMGEIKQSLAKEATAQETPPTVAPQPAAVAQTAAVPPAPVVTAPTPPAAPALRNDEMTVTLAPNASTEIKVTLNEGQKVNYKWTSTGKTNFDVHGDSAALMIDYHGYGKGSKERDEGVIEAAFSGNHGWFWRNRTTETVTIVLATHGEYSKIVRMD